MIKQESTRVAFTDAMLEMAQKRKDTLMVCADSVKVVKADIYKEKYPDRLVDVGIAEQNAVNTAAGLASSGYIPFVATYAGFLTMRACEQIRTFVAYPKLNVKLIGANGGIATGEREGVTHQFFEDIGIMRTIPGITVMIPADANQVKQAVLAAADIDGPVYIRIGSGRDPVAYKEPVKYEPFKINVIKKYGNDIALFTNGYMINRVLEAAKVLKGENINATCVDVHTVKPIDKEGILSIISKTKAAVTIEDHNIIGGLGSAIAEVVTQEMPVPIQRIGLRDVYPESGNPDELLDKYEMKVSDIVEAAKKAISKK